MPIRAERGLVCASACTGGGSRNARLVDTASSQSALASTHTAPTAGRYYAFCGASFKPSPVIDESLMHMPPRIPPQVRTDMGV